MRRWRSASMPCRRTYSGGATWWSVPTPMGYTIRCSGSSPPSRNLAFVVSTRFDTPSQRSDFLRHEADAVYAELTNGLREAVRVEELVFRAAERFPGLVPTRDEIAAERELPQARKRGAEIDQGTFLSHGLASPRAGRHLVHGLLRPRARSRTCWTNSAVPVRST